MAFLFCWPRVCSDPVAILLIQKGGWMMSKIFVDVFIGFADTKDQMVQGNFIDQIEITPTKKETNRDHRRFLLRQIRALRGTI